MVFFNHATRQMTAKIVYYGPGLCGKTTNLNAIYAKTSQKARGEMVSLNTETDRTLFFDLLPMDVGMVGGFKTKLQLYTVPGQVFYNSTRKLVLKGVDGIVFVADSQVPMFDANRESLQNLEENLRELGMDIGGIPMVFQWNKRDLKNVVPVEEMERVLNPKALTSFQSIAQDGTGVFETLRGVTRIALTHIKAHHLGEQPEPRAEAPVPTAALPVPPQADSVMAADPQPEPLQASELSMPEVPDTDHGSLTSLPSVPGFEEPEAPAVSERVPPAVPEVLTPVRDLLPAVEVQAPPRPASVRLPAMPASPLAPPKPMAAPPKPPRPGVPLAPKALSPMAPPRPLAPTLPGLAGGVSAFRIAIPSEVDAEEMEVVVQVKVKGQVVGEKSLTRAVPSPQGLVKLPLEIKRG